MNKRNRYLSLFLLGLILTGLFSSSVHLHTDQYDITSTDQQKITQDHNFCPICASQFKYEVNETLDTKGLIYEDFYHFSLPSSVFSDPLISIQNYRAPPSSFLIA